MRPLPLTSLARLRPQPGEEALVTNILALLALPLLAFLFLGFLRARTYALEFPVLTDRPVTLDLQIDRGGGLEKENLPTASLAPSREVQTARFEFPPCRLARLAVHITGQATVQLGPGEFRNAADEAAGSGRVLATLQPASLQSEGAEALYDLPLAQPLDLGFNWRGFCQAAALAAAEYLAAAAGALLAWRRLRASPSARDRFERTNAAAGRSWQRSVAWVRANPRSAIWAAAAAGVVLSCYPVIFCGKSFVSPNLGTAMLYDHFPTLPGYHDGSVAEPQGSDVLATMAAFVPYASVQRRALLTDHEFPLLDRYSQCAEPLLAQGQTMIGDPFHLLMLLAGANAWAWDARYLFSRLIFAAGLGLLVRLTTRQTAPALLLAFASCFLGFFQYRLNHPTYFCLCYAPWILYAWLRLPQAGRLRAAAPWIGALLAANWLEMNAGPVKDAYIETLVLNAFGALTLLLSRVQPWSRRWRILALTVWCQALLLAISNPLWVSAIDLVLHSWNIYQTPLIWQLQPNLIIGFFDDIFFRQFQGGERNFAPSVNFIVLLGVAFAVSHFKALLRERTFVAIGLCVLATVAACFGVLPPSLLKAVPFLGNVQHVDDVFSTILIVPMILLAGYGLAEARRRWLGAAWTGDYLAAIGCLLALEALYLGSTQAAQRSLVRALEVDHEVVKSAFFWFDAVALTAAFVAAPLLVRQLVRDHGRTALGLTPWIVLCAAAMLWRQGQQLRFAPALDRYVSRPQTRADFNAPSPAVNYLHRELREPGRVLGMQNNLFPGTSGMFGLEGLTGPDALVIPAYHYLMAAQMPFMWEWRLIAYKGTVQDYKATYDMLNVRYYLGAPHGHDIVVPGVRRVAQLDLDVFESRDVWPRAFFTDTLSACPLATDFLNEVAQDDHPLAVRPAALPLASLPAGLGTLPADQAHRSTVPATHYRLTNNTTNFEVTTPSRGVIVLTEVYNGDNKRVLVNGQPTPHFPVNMAFEGIYVDHAGTYAVSVQAWPRFLTMGLWISAGGLFLLLLTGAAFCSHGTPLPCLQAALPRARVSTATKCRGYSENLHPS